MPRLFSQLQLQRCPHCSVNTPNLTHYGPDFKTNSLDQSVRFWRAYVCARCGGVIIAASKNSDGEIIEMYPQNEPVHDAIPQPSREYLVQAIESLHAPAGCVMLAASSIDAMLKEKSFAKGSLNDRINKAAQEHVITEAMAEWAHEIRLDANEPRHADTDRPLPTKEDAEKCIDFALALAEYMYVLPSRVTRGRAKSSENKPPD